MRKSATFRARITSAVGVGIVLWGLTGCTVNLNLFPSPGPVKEKQISGSGSAKVLLMELSGMISSQDSEGLVSRQNLVAQIKEELTRAAEDSDVKALVIRINSPGGTVTASDILYHEIKHFKTTRKIPVIASIMDIGASGGYYIAAAADKIVAHPSSITGSLGVIMLTMNASGLLEKIGVQATAVTSGPRKDMGSPFRAMTEEERAIFQGVINGLYERFLAVIQEGRPGLQPEQIRKLADGRIYTGEQAKALNLIDQVGYLEEAIDLAKRTAGLDQARIVVYSRPGDYRPNIYAKTFDPGLNLMGMPSLDLLSLVRGGHPQFMYLWMP